MSAEPTYTPTSTFDPAPVGDYTWEDLMELATNHGVTIIEYGAGSACAWCRRDDGVIFPFAILNR
jgi:hypothetical protein